MDLTYLNPFLQIDSSKFEEVCRDLLGKQSEDGVLTCRKYEVSGNAQYGADIIANCNDNHSVVIGQCKRYETFLALKIAQASDKFLLHLDTHWNPNFNVKRFVLMVACKLERADQHAEIQKQIARFYALGIRYEVWDHDTLRLKLAPHPDLVRYHFPRPVESWVEVICGTTSPSYTANDAGGGSRLTLNLLNEQFEKIASVLSGEQARKLESIREISRRGRIKEAYDQTTEIREGDGWSLLDHQLQAKILKMTAALSLGKDNDIAKAGELVTQASVLDPDGDHTFIHALLAYYKDGPASALSFVMDPSDTESFNLKIAFYLEMNDSAEALRLAESPPSHVTPNTETKRLRSLALLGAGRIQEASSEVGAAVEEEPEWESVRTVKAIIDYYASLSPAVLPKHSLSWAEPVAWQFIKRDSESLTRMRAAEKHFAALAINTEKSGDQRLLFETWRLACLANDQERQDDAVNYCKELLKLNPAHPYALAWAITRNFDVDYTQSKIALEQTRGRMVNDIGDARIDGTLALMGIYLKQGELSEARKLLSRVKSELQKIGASSLYTFWLGQLAVTEGKFDEALALARKENNPSVRRRLKAMALRAKYLKTKAWKPFSRYLEKCFRKTKDGEYLMELCQLRAERKHWGVVADLGDQLIERVGTADAVRLAAIALGNAKRPAKCLRLMDEHKQMFPEGVLPVDLLRVRVHCQTRTGALAEAVTDAEMLVERDDATENIITLMDAQLQKADLRGLAHNARKLLQREDVDAASLLRAARFVHLEDAELAKRLWRQVKDDVLDSPSLLNEALNLSYMLGMEKESRPLFERMQKLAESGTKPFSYHHVSEFIPRMKKGADRQRMVQDLYTKGMLPLHFFAKESGYPLTDILHGIPNKSRKETDLRLQPKIFARHGGRTLKLNDTDWAADRRLYMDVTALLLAADLEILDDVEESFKPIRVSASLPKALLSQLEKLLSHQKSRIENHRIVLDALAAGKFQLLPVDNAQSSYDLADLSELANKVGSSWVSIAEKARTESAFLVDHLPLTSRDSEMRPVALPESLSPHVINCRTVLDDLYANGRLTDASYSQSLKELGSEGNQKVEEALPLPPNAQLFLMNHTVNALASAHLLDETCRHFRIFVDSQYIEHSKSEITEYNRHQELAEWLRRIKDRISNGISDGVYQGFDIEDDSPPLADDTELISNYDFATVNDLLRLRPQTGDAVWVDDRYTNSYSNVSGAPIITVTDVLAALLHNGKLTEAEYYGKLLLLRAGNIRYLPLTKEEILFHLKQARVIEDNLVETDELAVLRRYAAACLLDIDALQKPPLPAESPNAWGELSFVLETTGAVTDAITAVWDEEGEENVGRAKIRSNWLVDNLYTGKFGVRYLLPNSNANGDGLYHIGLDIGELLAKGIGVGDPRHREKGTSRRQQYFQWLNERLIEPRIKANPDAVAAAAKVLASIFSDHASQEYEDRSAKAGARLVMQGLFLDLPEPIKDELKLDPSVMSWLALTTGTFINIGSHLFPAAKFWSTAEQAINGKPTTITLDNSEDTFTVVKAQTSNEGSLAIDILDAKGASIGILDTPLLGVLWHGRAKRLEWLKRNRFWFDCKQEVFEREIEEIASLLDPRVRMDRSNSWTKQSAEVFYRDMERKFNALKRVNWTDLTGLSAEGLLRHYRLELHPPEDSNFSDVLSNSAKRLMVEEGLEATLNRVACLPVKIDGSVVAKLINLPAESRNELLERLALEWSSPVSKLHFLDLVLRSAPHDERAMSYAASVVEDLFSETRGASDFDLFIAVLNVINQEIDYWKDASEWSSQIKLTLVWAHASRLFNLLHAVFGSTESLTAWLLDPGRHLGTEVFARDANYWNDSAHPRRLNRTVFLTHGLASLLASNEEGPLNILKLPELVRCIVFRDDIEPLIPERELFRDPSLESNAIESIFGGDRAEMLAQLIGTDDLDILASCNLKQIAHHAIQSLKQHSDSKKEWSAITLVVGSLPLYQDMRDDFVALVETLDFESVLQIDVQCAHYALHVIASQKEILPKSILKRCEQWLMLLVERVAGEREGASGDKGDATMRPDFYSIVETALLLALEPKTPRVSSEAFKNLIYQMLNRWDGLREVLEPAMNKMGLELPLNQLHGIPELMLSLRAAQHRI